ncbi:hypothetical protein Hypma_005405 [Hypsizygus marmoreus]|uniref:Uncharacterized protein n=1 Tax=Hypsizygus marmoreus TaxID=39966 RepID=A0A369K4U7_HYPMA|nr:hypothetical protein Hypma_005405 [Hypsizygus marmoreus]
MPRARKEPSTSTSCRDASSVHAAAGSQSTRSTTTKRSTKTHGLARAKRSTTTKGAPKSSATQKKDAKLRELHQFAETVFKYTNLVQTTAESMWHDPNELRAAHERQYKIALANICNEMKTEEEIQKILEDLAARCEIEPRDFDDRVRICFDALAYTQVLLECVVCHPSRPFSDRLVVLRRVAEITREAYGVLPSSQDPPRLVKFVPDVPTTRPVEVTDVERWRAQPQELLRKAFIFDQGTRRVFLVANYCVKAIGGACYEVQFEDSGPDVFTFGLEDALAMVAAAELVTNV